MLEFTEFEQDPGLVDEMVAEIEGGYEFPEIVDVDGKIMDGHHRATAYSKVGRTPQRISLTQSQFDSLAEEGYDELVIAAAAHIKYGDRHNAEAYEIQFPGAGIFEDAERAAELL